MGILDALFGKKKNTIPNMQSSIQMGPTGVDLESQLLDAISLKESSGNKDPKRLTPNPDTGALGEYQITPDLYTDMQKLFPEETKGVSFEDAALGKDRRKFASIALKTTARNLASEGIAPTTDALIQGYHSGPGNVRDGNIGPVGQQYLKDILNLIGR